jgi:predicted ribosome quality control (RQC) complex YloA/Tae2 family protein
MDGLTFHKLLKLLDGRYKNAVLNRLSAEGNTLYLTLYKDGATEVLAFSAVQPPTLLKVPIAVGDSFGALKAVTGSAVAGIDGRNYDRLGFVRLKKRKPSGKMDDFSLVLEPMGKHANAFLLNEAGMIQFNLTVKSIDPDRDIGVGKLYIPPKINKKYSLDKPKDGVGFSEYVGFYPPTAKIADKMTAESGFEKAVAYLTHELNNGKLFYHDAAGRIFPFQDGTFAEIEFDELTAAPQKKERGESAVYDRLMKFYHKSLKRCEDIRKKLEEETAAALSWKKVLEEAELIKANLYQMKEKGVYVFYGEDGEKRKEYHYNSDKPPQKYMEELFKRAGKLRRSIPHIEGRLAEIIQLERAAGEQIYFIEKAAPAELKELFQLLNQNEKSAGNKVSRNEFLVFEYNNAAVYIGKNSASNYKLVFRFANQNDIWLHAHNIPSAHAIIRTDGGRVGDDVIRYAAALVARYSRANTEKSVEVDYTLRKHVKKPKNSPPGFVTYTHYKTVNVVPQTQSAQNPQ